MLKFPSVDCGKLIKAMIKIISGNKGENIGCACYDGKIFISDDVKLKTIDRFGECCFGGFIEENEEDEYG